MDVKQWMGMAMAGVGAMVLAFVMNKPIDLAKVPGARAPSAVIPAAMIEPAPAAEIVIPKASTIATPKPAAKPDEPKKEAPKAATPAPKPTTSTPAAVATPRKPGEKGPSVKGTVKWEGKEPKNPLVDPSSDPVCADLCKGKEIRKEFWQVNSNGTLKGVVVYVSKGLPEQKWDVRKDTVTLDQQNCTYVPHVVAYQLGQKVELKNSDPTGHNVHFKSKFNGDWNMTQNEKGTVAPKEDAKRAEVGTALFKCDIHTWMEARAYIFDHPFFAVTGDDGSFAIEGLPAGTYTLSTAHEKEKAQTMEVTVTADGTAEANFTFGKK